MTSNACKHNQLLACWQDFSAVAAPAHFLSQGCTRNAGVCITNITIFLGVVTPGCTTPRPFAQSWRPFTSFSLATAVHRPTTLTHLTLPRLGCSGVHPLDVSIRSRLVLFVLVTHLCCRYEQFETWGLHRRKCHHECSRHCNRQRVFCSTPSNTQS